MEEIPILKVEEKWFLSIKSGDKKFEGRLATHKVFTDLRDKIKFVCEIASKKEVCICRVSGILRFDSFKLMLEHDLNRTLPGVTTVEEGLKIYGQWYDLSQPVNLIELEAI